MTRRVFYSFHYDADNWRAAQVRNIGVVDGNEPASDNDWESIRRGGDAAIERWIDEQLRGTSCCVVLVGAETATRPWVIKEIVKAWNSGRGVVGVRIHGLQDRYGQSSTAGRNPFQLITMDGGRRTLADVATLHDPAGWDSKTCYRCIADGLGGWIEDAISARARY